MKRKEFCVWSFLFFVVVENLLKIIKCNLLFGDIVLVGNDFELLRVILKVK